MSRSRRRRPWHSIQFRVTSLAVAVLIAVTALGSIAVLEIFERAQRAQVDAELDADARLVVVAVSNGADLADIRPEQRWVQVVNRRGAVVMASANAPDDAVIDVTTLDRTQERVRRTTEIEGRAARILVEPVERREFAIIIVRRFDQATSAVRSLRLLVGLGAPLLVLALAALIWWVVGRSLRPVETVRATVDEISENDLSRRLPPVSTGDELERLVDTMNDMLGRLDTTVTRERRFVADASHELRSPLSGARSLLETETIDPSSIADTRVRVLDTLGRLETIVDDLLVLARGDAGAGGSPKRPVDLDEIVLGQADRLRRTTALHIGTSAVSGGQVVGRDTDLGRLIDNLTANAQRHATSTVVLSVVEAEDTVTLVVEDDGPGIAPADRELVFERFARLDEARSRNQGGAGLGLAIVASIVADHGGTIEVETSGLGGARFVVRLPASASTSASQPE